MAAKKKTTKKKNAKKKIATAKKSAKKKLKVSARKPAKSKKSKPARKKTSAKKTVTRLASAKKSPARQSSGRRSAGVREIESEKVRALRADADSQGLSDIEGADSESVSDLLDEGNAFEAGIVKGVEQADDADEREVRTREFPEDDVPEEYLENDNE